MAIKKLRDHFAESNSEDFNKLLKSRVLVTEKLAASSFHCQKVGDKLHYFKSNQTEPMDLVDRTIIRYYEKAIKQMQSISEEALYAMPEDWKFGFDYLPNTKPVDIEYDRLPKNFLVLTHIMIMNGRKTKKVIIDPVVLKKWAKILEVENPPILFDGLMMDHSKEELTKVLSSNDKAFSQRFQSESFTRFMYNMFKPDAFSSALNTSLDSDIDGLILTFVNGNNYDSYKLEDFRRINEPIDRKPSDMYQITILDMTTYLSNYNFSDNILQAETQDARYLELMSNVFNDYVKTNSHKFIGANFDPADFAVGEDFNLNTKFISNEKTLRYVENPVIAELFKILLGSYRKIRNKETDIISTDMMSMMNDIVKKIESKVLEEVAETEVLDFGSYSRQKSIKSSPVAHISEALKIDYKDQGAQPVNIFVGRFQPFTLGHVKVLETLNKANGFPVIVFLVKSKTVKKEDAAKRPYDTETQIAMFNKVQKEYPFLKEVIVVPSAAIDTMFNQLRPNYEPVLWGTGTDRMKAYGYMVDNDKYREELNVRADFGLHEIKRGDDDISATQVRNSMLDDEYNLFKKLVPKSLHGMYDELKQKLEVSLTANESVMTFEQFINKI
jgi:cytidyltransferase-like protein